MTSYSTLIAEHDEIEAAADMLLLDMSDSKLGAGELAQQLGGLARIVGDHIAREDAIVESFDRQRLSGPWMQAWEEGEAAFTRLRMDWIDFLKRWKVDAIEQDRLGFEMAAHAILDRMRERLQLETRAFYAVALQTGAIELR